MATDLPLLFLDVDGVLNPYGPRCPDGFAEHDVHPDEEPVRICAAHGAIVSHAGSRPAVWIDDLHASEAHAWSRARQAPTLLITPDRRWDSRARTSRRRSHGPRNSRVTPPDDRL